MPGDNLSASRSRKRGRITGSPRPGRTGSSRIGPGWRHERAQGRSLSLVWAPPPTPGRISYTRTASSSTGGAGCPRLRLPVLKVYLSRYHRQNDPADGLLEGAECVVPEDALQERTELGAGVGLAMRPR